MSNNTVTCPTCGESWDHDTPGYEEAMTGHDTCIACEESLRPYGAMPLTEGACAKNVAEYYENR